MKIVITSAAVAVSLFFAMPAFAQQADTSGAPQQPGGKSSETLGAPTGNIQGSQTGAANMNGPAQNGTAVGSSTGMKKKKGRSSMSSNSSMDSNMSGGASTSTEH